MATSSTTERGRLDGDSAAEAARGDGTANGARTKTSKFALLRRTISESSHDHITDWAAALTYYGLLALFPALIVLVAILGLFADPQVTAQKISQIVTEIGPSSGAQTFAGPIKSLTSHQSAAGVLLIVGIAAALWSASGYVGAFIRASNAIYGTPEGRPIWKLRPLQVLITLVVVLLVAALLLAIMLTGPIVDAVAGPLGIGSTATTIWDIAKWPVMLAVALTIVGILYYTAPDVSHRSFRWLTPGAVVAIVTWLIASAAFAFYVANFGSYDKTYGTLGGVVVLLVWLWITNLALLFGHELNAQRERDRQLERGVPDSRGQRKPRSEPADQRTS